MKNSNKGFTLIELLIVIAIIGTLAVLAVPRFLDAPTKSRDAERLADLNSINNAIVQMQVEGVPNAIPNATGCADDVLNNADLVAALGGLVPSDPSDVSVIDTDGNEYTGCYVFAAGADADAYSYGLFARLENPERANVACADLEGNPFDAALSEDIAEDGCYALLVQ